ncbi:MAG: hypothetical protein HC800_02025 [Phormidesmis sp. RL_2_1]|nr:hypothetical protein [Phormidesmis sp. RL_2_1]
MINLQTHHPTHEKQLNSASLCSLATLFWGWQTGLIVVALPMALLLEARRIATPRWEISSSDLKEVAKLCGVILALLLVVLSITKKSLFIYSVLQWLPVAAFPLVMIQTYALGVQALLRESFSSAFPGPSSSTFSNAYSSTQGIRYQRYPINLYYPYFAICLLAASAADSDGFIFL